MKKWLVGIIVAVVVVVAIIFGSKTLIAPKTVVMAEMLPQDVAFFYSIQNVETIWKDIKGSNFWKEFSNLKLWQDIQVSTGIDDLKKQFKENVGIDLNESNFLKLAGKELVIAVMPGAGETASPKILILSQGKNKQDLLGLVNPIIEKVKKEDPTKVEEIQYKGKAVSHVKAASADQPEIYFTLIDNVLVVGIGDTLSSIQKTIDISTGASKDSLASSASYQKIINLIGVQKKLAGLFYMDFGKMKQYLQGLTLPGTEGTPAQLAPGMDSINFIGGWTEIKDGLITKLYIYPNMQALTPEMKKMWQKQPEVPATIKLIPEKVLLYIGSSALDIPALWNMWQTNLKAQAPEQSKPILDGISNFEKDWSVKIDTDLLPLIGNEAAFFFSDINTEGILPIPRLGLALKVADKAKADKLISGLIKTNNEKAAVEAANLAKESTVNETGATEQAETETPTLRFQINLKDETYDDQIIKALELPLVGTGFAPGYTYADEFLVLGATTKTLQEVLDVKKGKIKPLSQDPMFQKLSNVLPKENNQLSYVNVERLMDIGIGICNWIINFQQMNIPQGPAPTDPQELEAFNQQTQQAQATIATIKDNVIPLLKTFKAIKILATASVNKNDYMEQTVVLNVQDI